MCGLSSQQFFRPAARLGGAEAYTTLPQRSRGVLLLSLGLVCCARHCEHNYGEIRIEYLSQNCPKNSKMHCHCKVRLNENTKDLTSATASQGS